MRRRDRVVSSVRWAVVESGLNAVTGLISTLTVGHFIRPSELGRAGAAMAVIGLVEIAFAVGIGEALVRGRSFHTSVTDSAHVGMLGLSVLGALACCAMAAPIAWVYHDTGVGVLIAVGSLLVPLSANNVVPIAILTRKMRIDVLAKRGIISKLSVLLVGGSLAYAGFGAWSIMISTFVSSALAGVCLMATIGRWPRLRLNWTELRALIAFGGPISLEILVVTITTRAFGLLFGAFHGLEALGYLQFAQRLIDEIAFLIQNFALRFGLTYFARIERDGGSTTGAFLLGSKMITFVGAPLLLGFAATSPDALASIIGARWLPATGFIVVAAFGWSTVVPTLLLSPALRARGRQKALVVTSVVSCALALVACVLTAHGGHLVTVLAMGMRHLIVLPAAIWMARRYLGIAPSRYVAAFAFPLVWALAMAACVWWVQFQSPDLSALTRLIYCVAGGAAMYILPVLLIERTVLRSIKPFVTRSS